MKKELISELFEKFEEACHDLDGLECWSAREMQEILGYKDWRNFLNAIQKASKACENSGEAVQDHFVGITKMVKIGGESSTFKSSAFKNLLRWRTGNRLEIRYCYYTWSLFEIPPLH